MDDVERTRIKICGITRVEDAVAAASAGADAIGMVFYEKARRCISVERAREILAALPPFVTPVGLFVDAPADEVKRTAGALGLRHVQLHGHEDADCVERLAGLSIIKAIRVSPETFQADLDQWREQIARRRLTHLRGLVLETASSVPGGSGVANDWQAVRAAQRQQAFEALPPIIAAGGLTPDNVPAVVRDLRPWAVDVSSGVEASFGCKSAAKIRAFVDAVRSADATE